MRGIAGKVCIITGGGTGIGKACAIRFASEGAKVVVCGRREEKLKQTVSEIKNNGGESAYLACDLTVEDSVKKLIDFTSDTFGPVKILINNAGDHTEAPLEKTDLEFYNRIIQSNLTTCFLCCKYSIPLMADSGGGSVVNISSATAIRGSLSNSAYSAAKGGILSLTYSLAAEFAPGDVRVNAVIPGVIKTEHYRKFRLQREPGYEKKILRHIPTRRLGEPDEVASVVLFLASSEASYITGAALPVDGGYCIK